MSKKKKKWKKRNIMTTGWGKPEGRGGEAEPPQRQLEMEIQMGW